MTSVTPIPTTVAEHLAGSIQSWHDKVSPDGPFLPEKDRYRLYIGKYIFPIYISLIYIFLHKSVPGFLYPWF